MVNISDDIRYYRKKANLTLEALAKGIISVPQLSRIENGQVIPKEDILRLLFEKLGIYITSDHNEVIHHLCQKWFKSILEGERELSSKLFNKINDFNIQGLDIEKLLDIHKLHFYILIDESLLAKQQYDYLLKISDLFNSTENYYLYKFCGNFQFYKGAFEKAFDNYKKAESFIDKSDLLFHDQEKSDLFYLISLTARKLQKIYQIIEYSKKALFYYQDSYNLKRCAECHVLMGLGFRRIEEYDVALIHYQKALSIAETLDDKSIISLSKQNIGHLFSVKEDSNLAIEYFLDSYLLKKEMREDTSVAIVSLVEEYYRLKLNSKALKWLEIGLGDVDNKPSLCFLKLKVFEHLIKGYNSTFENLILLEVIPFLESRGLKFETAYFYKILGDYYIHNRKYKKASIHFQLSNENYSKIIKH
ncbi:helix-turn-helix domain-containing protein [Aquibacillus salsiterrae]|uniref:Helix-turn-helix transcriptional regulator n=1 Tax=Aquibacillus salsiterrae TaxID=2950439 RepID=A0A9X3WE46_9BACI|nr:helix-turn-helix transcriptional regulator [Aquibacillus salsiterrae]MDC3417048.1 helix-turn-helix transcriptional regulator [Aquibacillus salsiterrae]